MKKVKSKQIKYLNTEELRRFFDVVKKEKKVRNELLFRLCFHLGLRVSELISLRLKDIHPKNLEIKINRLKGGISRTLPLCAGDIKLLKKWRGERSNYQYADENPYLFITNHSTIEPMRKDTVQKMFKKFSEKAGLELTNIHSLRHGIAVELLMKGFDIYFVKNWLGHSNIQSTQVYVDIAPPEWKKMSREAVESFSV